MPIYPTRLGHYETTAVGGEVVRAYVPVSLPPIPAVDLTGLQTALELANQTVGRLDGIGSVLPDPSLFLYMDLRKEALLSSQIEGTQSSLSDLLLYEAEEAPGVPIDDTREVSNYVVAMNDGLRRLREDFPLSRFGWSATCCRKAAARTRTPAGSAAVRTGSAGRGPAMRAVRAAAATLGQGLPQRA
ncbi:MAG: Fic/DOC family N-terminal domain-containing protein [Rhodopila sp.]